MPPLTPLAGAQLAPASPLMKSPLATLQSRRWRGLLGAPAIPAGVVAGVQPVVSQAGHDGKYLAGGGCARRNREDGLRREGRERRRQLPGLPGVGTGVA